MKLASLWLALFCAACASENFEAPKLAGHVNDTANVLRDDERELLTRELREYEAKTSHQFALLTVESLRGNSIESYTQRVFEAWKLGDAKRDDGLLFVVAVKDRKTRIEVGYGLEGAIPDLSAKHALDEAKPAFRAGEFGAGIAGVFKKLEQLANGEAKPPLLEELEPGPPYHVWLAVFAVVGSLLSIGMLLGRRRRRRERAAKERLEAVIESARSSKENNRNRLVIDDDDGDLPRDDPIVVPFRARSGGPAASLDLPQPKNPPPRSRPASPPPPRSSDDDDDRRRRAAEPVAAPVVVSTPTYDSSSSSSTPSGGDYSGGGGGSGGGGASSDF